MVEKKKIIDKKFIPTIISLIILIFLAVILYPVLTSPQESNLLTSRDLLFDFTPRDVSSIKIDNPSSPYMNSVLKKDASNNWLVNNYPAYNSDVNSIIISILNSHIFSTIDSYDNLVEFGLQPPKKILTIGLKSGKSIKILLGDPTPSGRKLYIKFPERKEIIITEHVLYSSLSFSPNGLRNKDIIGLELKDIIKFNINIDDKNYVLSKEDDHWYVLLPDKIKVMADYNAVSNILNSSFGNIGKSTIDKNEQLTNLNLNNPWIKVDFYTKDNKKTTVLFSKTIPSTQLTYAYNKSSDRLFLANEYIAKLYDINDLDIRNKKLIPERLSNIDEMIVKKNGQSYSFKIDKLGFWKCNKVNLDQTALNLYIEELNLIYVDVISNQIIDDNSEEYGFDHPILSIEFKSNKKDGLSGITKIGKKTNQDQYNLKISGDPFLYKLNQSKYYYINSFGEK